MPPQFHTPAATLFSGENIGPTFVVLAIIAVAILAIISWIEEQKRRRGIIEWAERRGFTFDPGPNHMIESLLPTLAAIRRGDNRYAYDLIFGEVSGHKWVGCHYHYQTTTHGSKGQKQTHHHHFSLAAIHVPIHLKTLDIRPESLLDKFATFFGAEDINFESAEFSRKYHVSSEDRRYAFDVLHARMIDYLLTKPTYSYHYGVNHIVMYKGAKFTQAEFDDAVEILDQLLNGLPDYFIRQQAELHGVFHP